MSPGSEIELFVRIVATAAIVIGVTLAAEHLGPKIGGALAGLPIVIGPAFFFLVRDQSVAFSADAAAAALTSLAATQAFLLGYVAVAERSRAAIGAAVVAWLLAASLLSLVPASPWLGLAIFTASMLAARFLATRFLRPHGPARAGGSFLSLVLRGLAAGLLVAAVTLAADRLGPVWAGFLIAYPIGMTVISVTLHQRLGSAIRRHLARDHARHREPRRLRLRAGARVAAARPDRRFRGRPRGERAGDDGAGRPGGPPGPRPAGAGGFGRWSVKEPEARFSLHGTPGRPRRAGRRVR